MKDQSPPVRVICALRHQLRNMSGAVNGPEQPQSVLKVQQLRRVVTTQQDRGRVILAGISFEVASGEILFVTGKHIVCWSVCITHLRTVAKCSCMHPSPAHAGPSGVGKSLLLRAVALLDPIEVSRMPRCAAGGGHGGDK